MVEKLSENKILREEILLNRERIEKKDVEGKIIKRKRKKIAELCRFNPGCEKQAFEKRRGKKRRG